MGPSPSVPADDARTLRWALAGDPTSLDPRDALDGDERLLADTLFDGLTRVTRGGDVAGAVARSWRASSDRRTFTFELGDAASWADGTPVVAEDVRRAWTRVLDATSGPPGAAAPLLDAVVGSRRAARGGQLTGLTTPDSATVVVRLRWPVPDFARVVAEPGLAPVPPMAVEAPAAFAEQPLGNGPWRLAEPWAHNQFLRLEAVPGHPRPGRVDELVLRVYASDDDGAQRYGDLLDGSLDVAELAPGDRGRARRDFGISDGTGGPGVHDGLAAAVSVLLLDTTRPPLDDVRVRRAVALLVDRPAMGADSAGERVAADALVPGVVPGAEGLDCGVCRLDVEQAGLLLDAALADLDGQPPAVRLVTSDDEVHRAAVEALAARLEDAGWPAEVEVPEPREYLAAAGEAHAVRVALVPASPLLRSWGRDMLGSGTLVRDLTGLDVAALRQGLAASTRGSTPAAQRAGLRTALGTVVDEAAVVPLLHYRDDLVVGPGVRGLVRGPLGDVDLTSVRVVAPDG